LQYIDIKWNYAININKQQWKEIYGEVAEGKLHILHLSHVKSLHEIGEEYEVDAVNDLIPICPNCHLVIHTKEPAYTPQEIKKMLKNKRLYNTIE
jgi:5-methylcytosine-specific restriction protein A